MNLTRAMDATTSWNVQKTGAVDGLPELEIFPTAVSGWPADGTAVVMRDESERWTPGAGLDKEDVCHTRRYWTGTVFQAWSL